MENFVEWIRSLVGRNPAPAPTPEPAPVVEPAPSRYINTRESPLGQELHRELAPALADGVLTPQELAEYLLSLEAVNDISGTLAGHAQHAISMNAANNRDEAMESIDVIIQMLRDTEVITSAKDVDYSSQLLNNLENIHAERSEGLFQTQKQ